MINMSNEREDFTTDTTNIKRINKGLLLATNIQQLRGNVQIYLKIKMTKSTPEKLESA